MASPTGLTIKQANASFRGIFDDIFVVRFTIDQSSIGTGAMITDTILVPGVKQATDVVIGLTHNTPEATHEVLHHARVDADGEIHLISHNLSAGPIDPASHQFTCVVARVLQ
jgi:hypothetical protein